MEMNTLTWNVRGFNEPFRAQAVQTLIVESKVGLVGLPYTKVKIGNIERVVNRMYKN